MYLHTFICRALHAIRQPQAQPNTLRSNIREVFYIICTVINTPSALLKPLKHCRRPALELLLPLGGFVDARWFRSCLIGVQSSVKTHRMLQITLTHQEIKRFTLSTIFALICVHLRISLNVDKSSVAQLLVTQIVHATSSTSPIHRIVDPISPIHHIAFLGADSPLW
jgi:hypothetical protein